MDGLEVDDNLQIPKRQAYFTNGGEGTLDVNCFEMFLDRAKSVHQYSIIWGSRGSSNISKRKKASILDALCARHDDLRAMRPYLAFDMGGIVISAIKVEGGGAEKTGGDDVEHRWEAAMTASGGATASNGQIQNNVDTVSISLKHVTELKYDDLLRYVEGPADQAALNFERKEQYLQALNIILQKYPREDRGHPHVRSGENSWFPTRLVLDGPDKKALDLGLGMMAVLGFFAAVRTAPSRLIVNMNSKASTF